MTGPVVFLGVKGMPHGEIRPDDGGDRLKFERCEVSGAEFPELLGRLVAFDVLGNKGVRVSL